jgi:hypothetical protein
VHASAGVPHSQRTPRYRPEPGHDAGARQARRRRSQTRRQRRHDETADPPRPVRTLHFGPRDQGLVTFLVYPPDDLVLVVRIQWPGD